MTGCEEKYNMKDEFEFTKEEVLRVNKRLYNSTAHIYDKDHKHNIFCVENQERVESILDFIIKNIKRSKNYIKLLDVGCGTGNILKLSKSKVDFVVGTDVSVECLNLASHYTNNIIYSDATCLPFKSASVDIITAYSVLHHLFDFTDFFREAYRMLDHKGCVYTDFDHNSLMLHKILARYKEEMLQLPLLNSLKKTIKGNRVNSYKITDYKLANYHNKFKGGINFQEVRKQLKKIGFRYIYIYFYKKQGTTYHTGRSIFSMLRYPFVYCIAMK